MCIRDSTQYFADLRLEDLVVVSPDAGRVKLAKNFAAKIGAELAILNKERPAQQVAEIGYVIGDVRGKTAVIVDDIIDTAGTLKAAAQTVLDEGASRVFAAATHPILSGNAYENLAASGFEQIVVTDTIPLRAAAPHTLPHVDSSVVGFGGSRSSMWPQTSLKTCRARKPAMMPMMIPKGL